MMINEENVMADSIKEAIENIKITPYSEVKQNLDTIARKTRKALGVKLHSKKPPIAIYNAKENN
jgi:hypothetical protein